MKEILPSKELIKEVLQIKDDIIIDIEDDIIHIWAVECSTKTIELLANYRNEINIYKFMSLCKKWAYERGYDIVVMMDTDSDRYESYLGGCIDEESNEFLCDDSFSCTSEFSSIFSPCEFILEMNLDKNKIKECTKIWELREFDNLVKEVYQKEYSFQQQDGCKARQHFIFTVPMESKDFTNTTLPFEINGPDRGIKFSIWKETEEFNPDFRIRLWWQRNFYPDFGTLVNELYEKGYIDAGTQCIDVDW
jgi:hypothetical protein